MKKIFIVNTECKFYFIYSFMSGNPFKARHLDLPLQSKPRSRSPHLQKYLYKELVTLATIYGNPIQDYHIQLLYFLIYFQGLFIYFFNVGVRLKGSQSHFDPSLQSKLWSSASDAQKGLQLGLTKSWAFHERVVSNYFSNFFLKERKNCSFLMWHMCHVRKLQFLLLLFFSLRKKLKK